VAEYEQMVLTDQTRRIDMSIRVDVAKMPRQGMSRIYRETRQIARLAGPEMMARLRDLALNSPDDRVAMMSAIAVLDRAGVTPVPYDEGEEARELARMPLAERREKLKMLMIRAEELTRERPGEN
jgi:hypothetical protein